MSVVRLLAVLSLVCTVSTAESPVYYVSPEGKDDWSGTLPAPADEGSDGPFATLHRAREALRSHGNENGLPEGGTVYVREGTYFLSKPLKLSGQDSGQAEAPVVWRAYKAETPRIVGGFQVQGFVTAEGAVVKADLSDAPAKAFQQLFCNSERQTVARWPNKGTGELPGGGWTFVAGSVADARKQAFRYQGDRPSQWADTAGVQVSIWPNYNWWQTIAPVKAVDTETKTATLTEALPYTIEPGRRFFWRNVREELDAAGEWYFDKTASTLYFWPPTAIDEAEVVVPIVDHAVVLEQAEHLTFLGFTVEATRGDGIVVRDSSACLVAKSTVRNTGGYGIRIAGGDRCRAEGNDIYRTGRGGIVLQGGDRKTLARGNHEAQNNHIHHFGELYKTYQTGVNIQGVGNLVRHNLIHDAPHIGILLGGNNHLLEYNEIHHVCMEGADNGGFYMGRDWTERGTEIRYNSFHDIYGFGLAGGGGEGRGEYVYESPHQAWGVYLDDGASGIRVYGNVFYRVPLCGVMIGGGRDNVVENNVFVDCIPAFHIDDRWDGFTWETLFERREAMNYTEPPYSEQYPALLDMEEPKKPANNQFVRNVVAYQYDDFAGMSSTKKREDSAIAYHFDQFDPETTTVDHNVLWHHEEPVRVFWSVYGKPDSRETLTWEQWQKRGFDKNSVVTDPQFFDPEKDDYRLRHNSPALQQGFEQIPTHRIGLYSSELRASPPPPPDPRRKGVQRKTYTVTLEDKQSP